MTALKSVAIMAALLSVAISGQAIADDPCESEDPLDFEPALAHSDCGAIAEKGWGTYDYEHQMARIPNGGGVTPAMPANYGHLPTSFSAWLDGLTPAERRQFGERLAVETGRDPNDMSAREVDAILTLLAAEMDDLFVSENVSAEERRKAIAEVAGEVGISIEPKATPNLYETYGRPDDPNEGLDLFGTGDPTGFGDPYDGEPESDLDPRFQ
jgi:hypothetical protein